MAGFGLGFAAATLLDDEPEPRATADADADDRKISAVQADVIVYLDPAATEHDRRAIEALIDDGPVVDHVFADKAASVAEFEMIFRNNPAMLAEGEDNPDLIPESYRLDVANPSSSDGKAFVETLEQAPGVLKVVEVPWTG